MFNLCLIEAISDLAPEKVDLFLTAFWDVGGKMSEVILHFYWRKEFFPFYMTSISIRLCELVKQQNIIFCKIAVNSPCFLP